MACTGAEERADLGGARVRLSPAAAASGTELTAAFVPMMHRGRRTCKEG